MRAMPSGPTVALCSQTPSPSAPVSSSPFASTESTSKSMVIATSAPCTASPTESATVMPSSANGSAFERVRFHARTSCPSRFSERAMPAPMVPVPITATFIDKPSSFEYRTIVVDRATTRPCPGRPHGLTAR